MHSTPSKAQALTINQGYGWLFEATIVRPCKDVHIVIAQQSELLLSMYLYGMYP